MINNFKNYNVKITIIFGYIIGAYNITLKCVWCDITPFTTMPTKNNNFGTMLCQKNYLPIITSNTRKQVMVP